MPYFNFESCNLPLLLRYIIVTKINKFKFPRQWKPPDRFSLLKRGCYTNHQWTIRIKELGHIGKVRSHLLAECQICSTHGVSWSWWLHFVRGRTKIVPAVAFMIFLPYVVEDFPDLLGDNFVLWKTARTYMMPGCQRLLAYKNFWCKFI